jgi:predicted transcriptional regulator
MMKTKTAKDIMNKSVITVEADMTVHELACFFTEKMITGAPVINGSGKLVGVVSVTDIIRNDAQRIWIASQRHENEYYLHGWEDEFNYDEVNDLHLEEDEGLKVHNIMTPVIFNVQETTPISEMADMMINGRIHRLLVTQGSKVIGIVTTLDMLKAIREYTKQ